MSTIRTNITISIGDEKISRITEEIEGGVLVRARFGGEDRKVPILAEGEDLEKKLTKHLSEVAKQQKKYISDRKAERLKQITEQYEQMAVEYVDQQTAAENHLNNFFSDSEEE